MEPYKDLLSIIRDILAIIGIGLALWRVFIMRNTFFSDHDRSRRTKAIDMIQFWSGKVTKQSSIARKIVESFNEQQCSDLANQKAFTIDSRQKELISEIIKDLAKTTSDTVQLNEAQSSLLRWEIINYLNQLESVLSAWRHNVADKSIIEEEFKYLYNPKENHTTLQKFRTAIGTDSYPGIREFITYLQTQDINQNSSKGKSKIGR